MKEYERLEKLLKAINTVSYEEKKVIVKVDDLLLLKNEIEGLRDLLEMKRKEINYLKSENKRLTGKVLEQELKSLDFYV
jgi:hypothetical protein